MAIGCHWLPFLRDSQINLAVVAVTFIRNDRVNPGLLLGPCNATELPRLKSQLREFVAVLKPAGRE